MIREVRHLDIESGGLKTDRQTEKKTRQKANQPGRQTCLCVYRHSAKPTDRKDSWTGR